MQGLTILSGLFILILAAADPSTAAIDLRVVATGSPDVSGVAAFEAVPEWEAPRRGTLQEVRDYQRREFQSPEVQEFAGGILDLIAVALLVVLIILVLD